MKKYKFTYQNSGVNINAADNFVKYIANLNKKTLQEDFWNNNDKAKAVLRNINYIENIRLTYIT